MTNSTNYSKIESEEKWQIIEHLVGMGYQVTSTKTEDGTLTVTLSVPLLSSMSYRVTQPNSKTTFE